MKGNFQIKRNKVVNVEKKKKSIERQYMGWVFITPWILGFLIFKFYPMMSSLVLSFSDYHMFQGISKWGFDNYRQIFANEDICKSLIVTFKYAFLTVPLKLIMALFIAYILNFKLKFVNAFRTAYYIPSILGGSIAIAVLWKSLFRDDGLINTMLAVIGVTGPNWLSDPKWALFVITLLRIWQFGSAMVIFLAALKGIPEELYEAGTVDGASKWTQFRSITVPLITPVIFYNLITQLVQAFQEFNGPYVITQGGPLGSTTLISLLIYNRAFKTYEMGMASAMAWVLFICVMILSGVAFFSQKYWVYYSDEEGREK